MPRNAFLKILKETKTSGTFLQYRWHIEEYLIFLKRHAQDALEITTPIDSVKLYMDHKIAARDWSRAMVNISFYALKWYWEKIMSRPLERRFFLNRGRKTEHEPRILSREEVERIWEAAAGLENPNATMIHVGWEAALRTGELVPIKGQNFLPGGTLEVRVLKTRRARKRVILTSIVFGMVEQLITKPKTPVFRRPVKEGYTRRFTPGEWSYWFQGWTEKILDPKGIRWHDFARHTRLTHFAEDTKSLYAVLQLSGHQDPKICRQYFERAEVEVPELALLEKKVEK